jgi:hypothetical protein
MIEECAHATTTYQKYGTLYCEDCWRTALARGLTPEEWGKLNAQAALEYRRDPRPKTTKIPPAPKPQRHTDTQIIAALTESMKQETNPPGGIVGRTYADWIVVATDGCRFLVIPTKERGKDLKLGAYLSTPAELSFMSEPAGFPTALRRVLTCADKSYVRFVKATEEKDLTITGRTGQEYEATETYPIFKTSIPARGTCECSCNAEWLLLALSTVCNVEFCGGALGYVRVRAGSAAWVYVQMGVRP